ncbi:hypothetical protein FVF58_06360 [Paraburkholderia panacisoli]|uniref:Uncharacterized protein n=1 Tax=Paraburkholderia panacisoli TaxID=2603818 RepID=A0A5B0HGR9_9BURK|nr:hypothetical protein [Paraburkholderia panacisoli]KAA1014465.1 hypothetical protein FVF58_06360 [Paraburkholderia panacisoli]
MEALMGVVQADLATHPMSESAVNQCAAPFIFEYDVYRSTLSSGNIYYIAWELLNFRILTSEKAQ